EFARLRAAEGRFRSLRCDLRSHSALGQNGFRFVRTPWDRGDAAKRDARFVHYAVRTHVERDSRGGERKLVGLAITAFHEARTSRPVRCGNEESSDQFIGGEGRLRVGPFAGRTMQLSETDCAAVSGATNIHGRIEGDESLCEVAGISRDAIGTDAE